MKKIIFMAALALICSAGLINVVEAKQNNVASVANEEAPSIEEGSFKKEEVKNDDVGKDDLLVINAKTGNKISDFVNQCYTDTYDGDGDGKLHLVLFSEKSKADSVFLGHDNIRVEFFDAAGNKVLTKNAINGPKRISRKRALENKNKETADDDKMQANVVDAIDKFDISFGQTYKLKFYDDAMPSTDENLLATYDLNIFKPEKSDNVAEFKFEIPVEGTYPFLNVCAGENGPVLSDRLKFVFTETENEENVNLNVACLSNDNNEDSVFKKQSSVRLDFCDENGGVLCSQKTEPSKVDERIKPVKKMEANLTSSFNNFKSCKFIKIYDNSGELIATYKAKEKLLDPHVFDVLNVCEYD